MRGRETDCKRTLVSILVTSLSLTVVAISENIGSYEDNGITLRQDAIPPVIIHGPKPHVLYRPRETIDLPCIASGYPTPKYLWFKDGELLLLPNDTQVSPRDGSLVIFTKDSNTNIAQGHYQCIAQNEAGTAVSNITFLEKAVLQAKETEESNELHFRVEEGHPLVVPCNFTQSIPGPTHRWWTITCKRCGNRTRIKRSERIAIHESGDLVFTHVELRDAQGDKMYKCDVYNPKLRETLTSNYARIQVTKSPYNQTIVPTRIFASTSPVIALLGEDIQMTCIFAGRPTPKVQWRRERGEITKKKKVPTATLR